MSAHLEDQLRRNHRAVQLEHILLHDEMFPPSIDDVGLEGASWGAIVEQSAIIDLEIGGESIDYK